MNVTAPRVSIIIAAYNARDWICEAVDSALAQVDVSSEVIVVDDGSTDDTAQLVHARYNDSIVYVYQPNRGLASARNTALTRARGEYIQFLDADDLLLPSKVSTHVAVLEANPAVSVAYSDFAYFENDDLHQLASSGLRHRYCSGDIWVPLIRGNFIVVHAALVRRRAVIQAGGFDGTLPACEDYDLWLRLAAQGCRFLYTPGVLALYRRRPGSMSSQRGRQIAATLAVLDKMLRTEALGDSHMQAYRRSVNQLHGLKTASMLHAAVALLRQRRYRDAGSALLGAVTYDPPAFTRRIRGLLAVIYEKIRYRLFDVRHRKSQWSEY